MSNIIGEEMQDIVRDILIRAREGDMDAFGEVYRTASDFVYNVAYRIINNREDAEEVTQDVFVKIYKKLKSFRFQSSFKTWIYRIAVNTAINSCKRRSKKLKGRVNYEEVIKVKPVGGTTREAIDGESNEERLKSMLDMLNPKQRSCVVLRDIEGLSYKEIAWALKININTVRSRLKRAREALLAFRQRRDRQ